jgi:hypothetical protein
MSGLKSFKWCREPSLIDSQLDAGVQEDLWTALRCCDNLRELNVTDAANETIEDKTEPDSSLWMKFRPIHASQVCYILFQCNI